MGKAFGHRSAKIKGDLFETPYNITHDLLSVEDFDSSKKFLEPCCGQGAIKKVVDEELNISMEYMDKYYGDHLQDFLEYEGGKFDYIITNPPYGKITDHIIMKAKEVYTEKMAFFVRINYLSGYQRHRKGVFKELSKVYIYTRMPDLTKPLREDGKYSSAMIVYCWLIFEKGYKGKPTIDWIDNQYSILKKGE